MTTQDLGRAWAAPEIAQAYTAVRPSYPSEAVDWLVPVDASDVIDLGAGSGQLSLALHQRGLRVTAVDPSEAMLAVLADREPAITTVTGTAEAIPVRDSSADAVLVAQAWHWVDQDLAGPEVARVLRVGGRLGLVWNREDVGCDWVAQWAAIKRSLSPAMSTDVKLPATFSEPETTEFEWQQELSPDDIVDVFATRSYVIAADAEIRAERIDQVRALVREHPDLAGRRRVDVPMRTVCVRATYSPLGSTL